MTPYLERHAAHIGHHGCYCLCGGITCSATAQPTMSVCAHNHTTTQPHSHTATQPHGTWYRHRVQAKPTHRRKQQQMLDAQLSFSCSLCDTPVLQGWEHQTPVAARLG